MLKSPDGYILVKGISSPDIQRAIATVSHNRSYLVPLSLLELSVQAHTGSLVHTERLPFDIMQADEQIRDSYCQDGAVYALHKRDIGEEMVMVTPTAFYQGKTPIPVDLWRNVKEYHAIWDTLKR